VPPAAAVVVAAAVVAVISLWPSGRGTSPAAGPAPVVVTAPGRILVQAQDGSLSLASTDGRHGQPLKGLGILAGGTPLSLAPDNRFVVAADATVVSLTGSAPAKVNTQVSFNFNLTPAFLGAFSDHDRAIVAANTGFGDGLTTPLFVFDLATGSQVPLGSADQVAADPRAAGAFVSVAAPPQPSATIPKQVPGLNPDTRLELREVGHPPVRLATASKINHTLGVLLSQPVALVPYPDPSGAKVAVVAYPLPDAKTGAVVILSRTGHVIDSVPAIAGPSLYQPLAWSPNGEAFAFVTVGNSGPELTVWSVGSLSVTTTFPDPTLYYGPCLWSPDGSAILCNARHRGTVRVGQQAKLSWAIASRGGGPMALVPAPGAPVAWLPRAGSR
jgi:WD40 repeat protein